MSTTFSVENPTIGFHATCSCKKQIGTNLYETYQAARDAIDAGVENLPCVTCTEYGETDLYTTTVGLFDEAPEVQMSNINAAHVLTALGLLDGDHTDEDAAWGLNGEMVGTLSGEALTAKVIEAQVTTPYDMGVPAQVSGNAVYCGREEGYTQDRLAQIREVAEFAWDHNLSVTWA